MSRSPLPEAPRVDDAIYSDAHIEYWGQRYVRYGWLYRGVTFMQFLARPERYEAEHANAPRPLLGRQRRVQLDVMNKEKRALELDVQRDGEPLDLAWFTQRAMRGVEDLPQRDGRIVEPLRHHRHPRNAMSSFALRQEFRR